MEKRPQASGKQLTLFEHESMCQNYRYSAYVTNLDLSAAEVWRLYRKIAEAENRIKELKYDFGFESFNMRNFYGTEAALNMAMMAYNLMCMFRLFIMNTQIQKQLSTLRFETFAIGA
ncbi:MAG: transposase [Bacteroidales bacterium]